MRCVCSKHADLIILYSYGDITPNGGHSMVIQQHTGIGTKSLNACKSVKNDSTCLYLHRPAIYSDAISAGWEFPQKVVNSKGILSKMALNQAKDL